MSQGRLFELLCLLLERGLISEDEYGKICRYNAEFFKPGREYI